MGAGELGVVLELLFAADEARENLRIWTTRRGLRSRETVLGNGAIDTEESGKRTGFLRARKTCGNLYTNTSVYQMESL